ncbi:hypothetical protein MTR67_035223 [Solanum verrucosum]|uniref:Uncharacterized protein n=1 Tax=Solanum verrucosum TaxID=315347 RepID=A0AAF0ZLA2_SOLVR|nr:hypothetical protein MTR67_035223 [Solanum verrucosum]
MGIKDMGSLRESIKKKKILMEKERKLEKERGHTQKERQRAQIKSFKGKYAGQQFLKEKKREQKCGSASLSDEATEVPEIKKKLSQIEETLQRQGEGRYIEAQRRLKVDEELRLDEMRACVGRDSSRLVLTKVGLISGVDVVRESHTLTTTPPASEGTLEVSLSASATIDTTIHILGDTKASAPIPEALGFTDIPYS